MLRAIRSLLVILNIGNWLCGAVFVASLVGIATGAAPVVAHLTRKALPGHEAELLRLFTLILTVGIATVVPVHLIFRRLVTIIDTVTAGQPFSATNAGRLRVIAWALLAIQLLDLLFGLVGWQVGKVARPMPWGPSLSGWLAVLLLFVLARVFTHGAALERDLEGTV